MRHAEVYQYIVSHIRDGAYNIVGKELFLSCPDCGNDDHFSINITNGYYNCFKCPVGGRLAGEIVNHRLEWKRLTNNLLSKDFLVGRSTGKIDLPKNAFVVYNVLYPDGSSPRRKHVDNSLALCTRAFKYCIKRGLTKEQIRDYRVYVCPMDPRVYFPYWDEYGEITYFMGRKMMGNEDLLKTKDSENTGKPLFGRQVKVLHKTVILVEGVFDHFVTQMSYALMGSSISTDQILQLREDDVKRVFILGDPDASRSACTMAQRLRNFRFHSFPVFVHLEDDPGKLGREKMDMVVAELMDKNWSTYQPIHIGLA